MLPVYWLWQLYRYSKSHYRPRFLPSYSAVNKRMFSGKRLRQQYLVERMNRPCTMRPSRASLRDPCRNPAPIDPIAHCHAAAHGLTHALPRLNTERQRLRHVNHASRPKSCSSRPTGSPRAYYIFLGWGISVIDMRHRPAISALTIPMSAKRAVISIHTSIIAIISAREPCHSQPPCGKASIDW